MTAAADRHLLFGLLALQTGIVTPEQLVEMSFRAVNAFRTQDGLDPLWGRDDFLLLMMDREFPSEPFAPDTYADR
jgi:hypothetical protein